MTPTVGIDELKIGMFVHLDLGWWAHPFALSSFQITADDQIATLRGLGLKRLRWSPEKSQLPDLAQPGGQLDGGAQPGTPVAPDTASDDAVASKVEPGQSGAAAQARVAAPTPDGVAAAQAAQAQQRARLAGQRAAEAQCQAQLAEARAACAQVHTHLLAEPDQAREVAQALTRAVVDKMLSEREVCVRTLGDAGGDPATAHALNVMVVSLLMGRVCGLGEAELLQLGQGALLHDIGKLGLPVRLHQADPALSADDLAQYRHHVALGVAQGQRMGLPEGVIQVLAQHHEMADGSGFPGQVALADIGPAARIVALVNRYDNLCNPRRAAEGLTPHDALAVLFAQSRNKFDGAVLSAFIRMMGVYPPGSVVQLTDERYATVVSVNPARPLKPRVLVCDFAVPADEALLIELDTQPDLGIRRSLKPPMLPAAVRDYLSPRPRMVYFFEPALQPLDHRTEALAA